MKPLYFDIHTHVHFEAFKEDALEVLKNALDEGVFMIQVGTQKDTSKNAVAIAERFDGGVYASIGLHPIHTSKSFHDSKELGKKDSAFTSREEIFDTDYYKKLAESVRVVAIGECGLDYYRLNEETKKKQKDVFFKQVELALELDIPLMIHCRPSAKSMDAYEDILEIFASYSKTYGSKLRGNIHFFVGSWEIAKKFLDFGFTLSFTGVITFTHDYDEVIKNTPIDMIMTETDAPYVSPLPYRGKRNEPQYVKEVVKQIARVRGEDIESVSRALVGNALRVFNINP